MPFDRGNRLEAVARLRHHFLRAQLSELVAQFFTRQRFVVDDHDLHAVICSAAMSSGISMRARVPLPGSLAIVSW